MNALDVIAGSQLDQSLAEVDPEVRRGHRRRAAPPAVDPGDDRLARTSPRVAVMEAQGSVLTNKYAEGYPGRRYYGGCEHVDVIEQLAIDRVKALFGAEYANVQPHSGAQANAAAHGRAAAARRHDPRPRPRARRPPHPRHAAQLLRQAVRRRAPTTCARTTTCVDMDEVERLAREHRPKLIIAGWSAYPRQLDFARVPARSPTRSAPTCMVDMAHFAGLVAAGLHPSPVPHAHVVTTTTHKTLGGPRGGVILTNDPAIAKKINSAVFPGQQGGPLEHVIAAKAVAFKIAAEPDVPASARRAPWTAPGSWPTGCSARRSPRPGSACSPAAPTSTWCWSTCGTPSWTASRPRTGCTQVGITVNRNAVPVRPAPADGQLRRADRHPGAGHPRLRRRRLHRGRRHHRRGAAPDVRRRPTLRRGLRARVGARWPPLARSTRR